MRVFNETAFSTDLIENEENFHAWCTHQTIFWPSIGLKSKSIFGTIKTIHLCEIFWWRFKHFNWVLTSNSQKVQLAGFVFVGFWPEDAWNQQHFLSIILWLKPNHFLCVSFHLQQCHFSLTLYYNSHVSNPFDVSKIAAILIFKHFFVVVPLNANIAWRKKISRDKKHHHWERLDERDRYRKFETSQTWFQQEHIQKHFISHSFSSLFTHLFNMFAHLMHALNSLCAVVCCV